MNRNRDYHGRITKLETRVGELESELANKPPDVPLPPDGFVQPTFPIYRVFVAWFVVVAIGMFALWGMQSRTNSSLVKIDGDARELLATTLESYHNRRNSGDSQEVAMKAIRFDALPLLKEVVVVQTPETRSTRDREPETQSEPFEGKQEPPPREIQANTAN
ncbi:MAG: hypothetical protein FWD31_02105 [Planctomycetaceae bacterium]|nr:hypothetical protein [Planctomycetaceae bacterium]